MKYIVRFCVTFALLFLIAVSADGATNLPQKAFDIEGGVASVRAGVIPHPDGQTAPPIGKLRYPTRYFIEILNESQYPIWLDATWTFPDPKTGKPKKSKVVRSTKTPPQGSYVFYWDKYGVLVDQAIMIELHAYADEKRTRRVGNQDAELMFDQQSVDVFLANFPSSFKNQSEESRQAAVISGWHDIPRPRTDVPGSNADAELQADIQLSIWKADSTRRWTCDREMLSAESIPAVTSMIVSRLPADARESAAAEEADELISVERWLVRSCGLDLAYEVLLSKSQRGGTDIMVVDTTDWKPE